MKTKTILPTSLFFLLILVLLFINTPVANARPACMGKAATIVVNGNNKKIIGKRASDVIFVRGNGNFVSGGKNGNDTICVIGNKNKVRTERGNDKGTVKGNFNRFLGGQGFNKLIVNGQHNYLNGWRGSDKLISYGSNNLIIGSRGFDFIRVESNDSIVYGGDGADIIKLRGDGNVALGQKGNDDMFIDGGNRNILRGDMGDDNLITNSGNENRIFGSLGADTIKVKQGHDNVLRGDSGWDLIDGGPGDNIASFATHVPPGASAFGYNGIYAPLRENTVYGQGFGINKVNGTDRVRNVDKIIGSAFDDEIVGTSSSNVIDAGLGENVVDGYRGNNKIYTTRGQACVFDCAYQPLVSSTRTTVSMGNYLGDGGTLYVLGGNGNNAIDIQFSEGNYIITDSTGLNVNNVSDADTGQCRQDSPQRAVCSAGKTRIDTIVAYTGKGNNTLNVGNGIPNIVSVNLGAGPGNNLVTGSNNDDYILGGRQGTDILRGRAGSDSIQTYCCNDRVFAGGLGDLIVVNIICNGAYLNGGGGKDLVGFAPSQHGVRAKLGGRAIPIGPGCNNPLRIANNNEGLEGTKYNDILIGNRKPNAFLGRKGRDVCNGVSRNNQAAYQCEVVRNVPSKADFRD